DAVQASGQLPVVYLPLVVRIPQLVEHAALGVGIRIVMRAAMQERQIVSLRRLLGERKRLSVPSAVDIVSPRLRRNQEIQVLAPHQGKLKKVMGGVVLKNVVAGSVQVCSQFLPVPAGAVARLEDLRSGELIVQGRDGQDQRFRLLDGVGQDQRF